MPATLLDFTILHCAKCAVPFSVSKMLHFLRTRDGGRIFCPNGHPNTWTDDAPAKPTEAERTARDAKLRALHDAEQREAREADGKGGPLVIEPPAADGMSQCPCCDRRYRRPAHFRAHLTDCHGIDREAVNEAIARGLGTRA